MFDIIGNEMLLLLFILSLTTAAIVEMPVDDVLDAEVGALPNCICVPIAECINGEVITAGQNLTMDRSGFVETIVCNSSQIQCLMKESENEIVDEESKDTCKALNKLSALGNLPRVNDTVTRDTEDEEVEETEVNKPQCGIRLDDETSDRYADYGPEEAGVGEFSWTVIIYQRSKAKNKKEMKKYMGVGSLISPTAVLTMAHRFIKRKNRANLLIRAGTTELDSEDLVFPHQDSNVKKVIIHDDYDSGRKANDVALFILEADIIPADTVGFVCLPPATRAPEIGTLCYIAGWGSNKIQGPLTKRQKMLELPIVHKVECLDALFNTSKMNHKYSFPPSTMCAGGQEGVDACRGDGGAPLVCPYSDGSKRYYQAGITSWGIGCGEARPGLYSSVSHAREWIDRQMTAHGLPIDTYTAPEDQP